MEKKLFALITCLVCITSYLFGDIYPAPTNLIVSKGDTLHPDEITISWKAPVPPEFGEGFEAGIMPPVYWDTLTTNADSTWQIMDNADYAHSGSYAACVPYTYSEGEFLGFDSTRIMNGSFNEWTITPGSVIISEMCDPKSNYRNNRFIEIYNSGEDTVDLADWELVAVANNNEIHTWSLFGDIAPGQALACGDTACTVDLDFEDPDWSDDNSSWDGRSGDGAKLKNAEGIFVDIAVVSSTVFRDRYVYRRKGICFGNTSYNSGEWIRSSSNQDIEDASPGTHTGALQKLSLPDYWQRTYVDLLVDTLAMLDSILAISSDEESEYLYQDFSVSKYAKYKLSFKSKQDSLNPESKYKIEVYDNTNNSSLLVKDTLHNFEWKDYEFDIHTSSCASIKIKLFPSDKGDSIKTYWDDIKFEKYNYEPNQDEWLISPEYVVKSGDELNFYLGTSKTFGMNSPVYVLLYNYNDGDTLWNDTLIVCDGMDHDENYWEYKEYNLSLNSLSNVDVGDTIQIAFRYLGGNGDLVCLDDVSIGGETKEITGFFVIPVKNPKVKFVSRAPLGKSGRGAELSGYKLYRRMYHDDRFYEITDTSDIIPDTTVISDTIFIDTAVAMDTVYVYKAKAIYQGFIPIPSAYSNLDTGYVYDNSVPTRPYNVKGTFSGLSTDGKFSLTWEDDTTGVKHSDDIRKFNVYDAYGDSLFETTKYLVDQDEYKISRENSLPCHPFQFYIKSEDFAGNESPSSSICDILPPPKLLCKSDTSSLENKIKLTISKFTEDICLVEDSIKIYKSTSEEDSTFSLLSRLTEESIADSTWQIIDGEAIYVDTLVTNGTDYYYYATFTYDLGESIHSRKPKCTPKFQIKGIKNLEMTSTDTSVIFSWDEPDDPDYAGVYVYTHVGYPDTYVAPISAGTTSYEAIEPGIFDFYFVSFDSLGNKDRRTEYYTPVYIETEGLRAPLVRKENVVVGLYEETKNFDDGSLTPWTQEIVEGTGTWQVSDDGSSQWFSIPDGDSIYAWINDDSLGQFGATNCYLIMPSITGLSSSDKVYLRFDGFFKKEHDGSAYLSIKTEDGWNDVVEITENIVGWELSIINLSSYIDSSYIDSFQIAFHYNDNGTWSQGWAVDNVSLLASSYFKSLFGMKFSSDTKFYLYTNYPNPFNPFRHSSTNFSFFLAEPAKVSLEIYNIRGQKISTIAKEKEFSTEGLKNLSWNGTDNKGRKVATGIYLYRMKINNQSKIKKLMVIR